uniref:Uncharacterized protein n=1 Tax=Pristionchus pacificus TaxID=54126 RepID=A0A2A6BUK7_PRIPA|eukprot:PDM69441.1 hypothetical protein PRIPAC_44537 [Pristionchus pacificus]
MPSKLLAGHGKIRGEYERAGEGGEERTLETNSQQNVTLRSSRCTFGEWQKELAQLGRDVAE